MRPYALLVFARLVRVFGDMRAFRNFIHEREQYAGEDQDDVDADFPHQRLVRDAPGCLSGLRG